MMLKIDVFLISSQPYRQEFFLFMMEIITYSRDIFSSLNFNKLQNSGLFVLFLQQAYLHQTTFLFQKSNFFSLQRNNVMFSFISVVAYTSFYGGFHLHLLVFPFVSILEQRLQSGHHLQMTNLEGFQHHFTIISKSGCCGCYMKKECSFYSYFFCCTEM